MQKNRKHRDLPLLLQGVKDGDDTALEQLLDMFEPLIITRQRLYSGVLDADEVEQLSSISIFEAAKAYSPRRGKDKVTFGLYAKICIDNRLKSETRKEVPPVESIDELKLQCNGLSMEEELADRDSVEHALKKAHKELTPLEERVFLLYLEGHSYKEIADILDIEPKAVGNAMSRARRKLRDLL